MSSRRAALWILAFAALALAGSVVELSGDEDGPASLSGIGTAGRVVDVVDGDTVKVRLRRGTETVRYIGVDTPETVKPGAPVECFGRQASALNRRLVAGRKVRLRFGPERRDRYGRLLAYVYVRGGGRSVSAELIARGAGRELTIAPNEAHEGPFERLEREARRRGAGLWGSCP